MTSLIYVQYPAGYKTKSARPEEIERIKLAILKFTGIEEKEIMNRWRKRDVVYARHLICYFLKKKTNLTCKSIGAQVGRRDHTTVLHSIQQIRDLMFSDPSVLADVKAIGEMI